MRIHSDKKIRELKESRRRGYSINELVSDFSVPKSTVWHHVHKIIVDPEYVPILKSKIGGSRKRKEKNIAIAKELAKKMINSSDREYIIVLAMLYWAEGCKKACEFINSDGRMIDLYVKILVKVFDIPRERLIPTIRIVSSMDQDECLEHWSKITGLQKNKFFVRINDGITKSSTKYGMCRISIKKGSNTLKLILSLIEQTYDQLIKSF